MGSTIDSMNNGGRGGAGALGLLWVATGILKKLKLALGIQKWTLLCI